VGERARAGHRRATGRKRMTAAAGRHETARRRESAGRDGSAGRERSSRHMGGVAFCVNESRRRHRRGPRARRRRRANGRHERSARTAGTGGAAGEGGPWGWAERRRTEPGGVPSREGGQTPAAGGPPVRCTSPSGVTAALSTSPRYPRPRQTTRHRSAGNGMLSQRKRLHLFTFAFSFGHTPVGSSRALRETGGS
jgi:hypothetical protein